MAADPISVTTYPKLFGLAKELPLSALTAATFALWLLLLLPVFRASVPQASLPYLLFAALFFSALLLIAFGLAMIGLWYSINAPRLLKLYGPLYALLMPIHITTSSGINSPRFHHRWENATEKLSTIKSQRRWKAAWRALFDRQESTSGEIEYGSDLPRSKIVEMVQNNERYADPKLLGLVRRMDRATYEDPQGHNGLSDEDLALCDYIYDKYLALKRWIGLLSNRRSA